MSDAERPDRPSKRPAPLNLDSARAGILAKLQKAGAKGTAALATKAARAANEHILGEALRALELENAIFIDRSSGNPKYFLKEFAPIPGKWILDKLRKAGATGSPLVTASTPPEKRVALESDAAALESEGQIVVDRSGKKPKYYLREFAPISPSLDEVCAHLDGWAASKYPHLLSANDLKRRLTKAEAPQYLRALYWLEHQRELIRFELGAKAYFVSARALRKAIGADAESSQASEPEPSSGAADAAKIRKAYQTLTSQSGFPSVKIDQLQRESGVPLRALQDWLREEHQQGHAVLSFGDWSLSGEGTRAAAIELRGDRYLLVRLLL